MGAATRGAAPTAVRPTLAGPFLPRPKMGLRTMLYYLYNNEWTAILEPLSTTPTVGPPEALLKVVGSGLELVCAQSSGVRVLPVGETRERRTPRKIGQQVDSVGVK